MELADDIINSDAVPLGEGLEGWFHKFCIGATVAFQIDIVTTIIHL